MIEGVSCLALGGRGAWPREALSFEHGKDRWPVF